MALHDICVQLITHLTAAAKDKSDPLGPIRILAHCVHIVEDYASEGFVDWPNSATSCRATSTTHSERHEGSSCGNFFCAARRPIHAFCRRCATLAGPTKGEAGEDYEQVVHELFDGDDFRPAAKAERARRHHTPR
jgi:hypothetical protein